MKSQEENEMSFWGHLEVLRWALIRVAVALVVLVVATFVAMPYIFDKFILGPTSSDFFLYRMFASVGGRLPFLPDFGDSTFSVDIININVASQFMTHVSTSFWLALVLVFPYLIYQIWKFVRPALFPQEVRNMRTAFLLGTGMFYVGCAVGYCIVFPFTFRFLVEYQLSASVVNQISLNSYISTFLIMVFIMGAVFELPLLAWILSKLQARSCGQGHAEEIQKICSGGTACTGGRHHPYGRPVHPVSRIYPSLSPLRTLYRPCRSQTGSRPRTGE